MSDTLPSAPVAEAAEAQVPVVTTAPLAAPAVEAPAPAAEPEPIHPTGRFRALQEITYITDGGAEVTVQPGELCSPPPRSILGLVTGRAIEPNQPNAAPVAPAPVTPPVTVA